MKWLGALLRGWGWVALSALLLAAGESVLAQQGTSRVRTELPLAHSLPVTGLARLEGLGLVVSASEDGRLKVWEEHTGLLISETASPGYAPLGGVASDPSHPRRIAVATLNANRGSPAILGGDATIRILDAGTGRTLQEFPGQSGRMRFSPTGRWLTSSAHSLLSVWNVQTGRLHVTLQVNAQWADFAGPDSLVYRREGRLVFLDLNTGASRTIPTGGQGGFAVSRDGRWVADVGDKELRVWRASDGAVQARHPLLSDPEFMYFAPDGSVVAGGHAASIWTGSARNLVYRLTPGDWSLEAFTVAKSPITMLAEGGDALLFGQRNGRIQRVAIKERVYRPSLGAEADDISAVAFSPDGRYLAAGYAAGGAAVWEPTSNWYRVLDPLSKVRTPPEPAFSDNEKKEHITQTWIAGGGVTNAPEFTKERVIGLTFLGPEKLLMVHQSGAAEILNIADGRVLEKFVTQEPLAVVAGSSVRTAILGRRGVTFIDSANLARRVVPIANSVIRNAALSPSGDRLIIHTHEAVIELNATTGAESARGQPRQGAPIFLTDGTVSRLAWRTSPASSDPPGWDDTGSAFDWSPEDNLGVLATTDGQIRVWSSAGGKFDFRDFSIGGLANAVALSPDGRNVAIGSGHGRIAIYRAKEGVPLADLVSLDRRGWLARGSAPGLEGSFDGSYAAWDKLRGTLPRSPLAPIDPANFFSAAFRPQLLAEAMGEAPAEPLGAGIADVQRQPPTLHITAPMSNYVREASPASPSTMSLVGERRRNEKGEPLSFGVFAPADENSLVRAQQLATSSTVLFKAEVQTSTDGMGECRIFRNRRLLRAIVPQSSRAGVATIETILPLREGDNVFSAYCFSQSGLRSREAEVRVFGADSLKSERTAFVLSIGIDAYMPRTAQLKFAVADANLAQTKLSSALRATGQYTSVRVATLRNVEAAADTIQKALRILAGADAPVAQGPLAELRASTPSDAVFVYFAGHGGGFAGDYRLIAADGRVGSNDAQGTVSASQIRDALEPLQADRTVVIIDACESGQALDQVDARAGPLAGRSLAQLAYDKAIFIISAAQSRQAALELQRLGHGVFSYVLFERGFSAAADENSDGFTSIREWLAYAQAETPKEVEKGLADLTRQKPRESPPKRQAKTRSTFADEVLNRAQTPRVFIPDPQLAREFVIVRTGK